MIKLISRRNFFSDPEVSLTCYAYVIGLVDEYIYFKCNTSIQIRNSLIVYTVNS